MQLLKSKDKKDYIAALKELILMWRHRMETVDCVTIPFRQRDATLACFYS